MCYDRLPVFERIQIVPPELNWTVNYHIIAFFSSDLCAHQGCCALLTWSWHFCSCSDSKHCRMFLHQSIHLYSSPLFSPSSIHLFFFSPSSLAFIHSFIHSFFVWVFRPAMLSLASFFYAPASSISSAFEGMTVSCPRGDSTAWYLPTQTHTYTHSHTNRQETQLLSSDIAICLSQHLAYWHVPLCVCNSILLPAYQHCTVCASVQIHTRLGPTAAC